MLIMTARILLLRAADIATGHIQKLTENYSV